MSFRALFFSACVILFSNFSFAQKLNFKIYSVNDGLVSNSIIRIHQDNNGFLWMLSWEGISKYDGYQFINFTEQQGLSSNMVNDVYESGKQLFVAENNGTVDILESDTVQKKPLAANIIINRFFGKNEKLLGTTDAKGFVELDHGNIIPRFPKKFMSYYGALQLKDTFFLLHHENYSIDVIDKNYQPVFSLPTLNLTAKSFFYMDDQTILAGTKTGLKILQVNSHHELRFIPPPAIFDHPALLQNEVSDIVEDPYHNFWFGTSNGLIKIAADGSYQRFTEKSGLPSNSILCLFNDKQKNLWISTRMGLAKLNLQMPIENYSAEDGLEDNQTYAVVGNDDKLFLKTGPGLQVYDKKTKQFSSLFKGKEFFLDKTGGNNFIYLKAGRTITLADLQNISKQQVITNTSLLDDNPVYTILSSGNIVFVGTEYGIKIFKDKQLLAHWLDGVRISSFYLDKKDQLWAGTWDKGLFIIHDYRQNYSTPGITDISNFLPGKAIRCLMEDSLQNMWVGTRYDGLACLSPVNGSYHSRSVGVKDGLSSPFVRSLAEDSKGNIWIGTEQGLDKLIPNGKDLRLFSFSRQVNYYFLVNDIFIDRNDVIWCGSMSGLVRIQPAAMQQTTGPNTFITSITTDTHNNKAIWWSDKENLSLPFSKNHIQFEFASPDFVNEKQILFSYRLLGGSDTSWSKPAGQHSISFVSLQPGHYNFQVHSVGINGERGNDTSFQFTIGKPYWQTWWFYSLLVVGAFLIFYFIYRYRIGQLLKMQHVRNNIATDLHDEIGSTLTNINLLSEISRKNIHQPAEAEKFLHRISEEVTTSSQALDDIIWSVNTNNDSVNETFARMRRYSAELFENTSIACTLDFETGNDTALKMEKRKDVFLIYKELLNNILKHSKATTVNIHIKTIDGYLRMVIADNGKGFDIDQPTYRNGLKNLKLRVTRWKGQFNIESNDTGTTVNVNIPL